MVVVVSIIHEKKKTARVIIMEAGWLADWQESRSIAKLDKEAYLRLRLLGSIFRSSLYIRSKALFLVALFVCSVLLFFFQRWGGGEGVCYSGFSVCSMFVLLGIVYMCICMYVFMYVYISILSYLVLSCLLRTMTCDIVAPLYHLVTISYHFISYCTIPIRSHEMLEL